MKYQQEYRDPIAAGKLRRAIGELASQPWTIMEICGGPTPTTLKYGIDELLPSQIELVHGPGCPVCVTPLEQIDRAVQLAERKDVTLCSYGDMLRVPGSRADLLSVKAQGGDVRLVYSPLDALRIALENPQRTVVFFAVGFETTAPANAMAAWQAKRQHVNNFTMLVSQVRVPPAIEAILTSPDNRVQGFLAAGHVCTVMGYEDYEPLAERFKIPIVVTGFEPLDLLEGVYRCLQLLTNELWGVENQYVRAVRRRGNPQARSIIEEVFEHTDRKWRGIDTIPDSGYRLRPEYAAFDAEIRFELEVRDAVEATTCISGQVLQGVKKPHECIAFGTTCTPQRPLGATMVSSEGACAAYYNYGRHRSSAAIVGGAERA